MALLQRLVKTIGFNIFRFSPKLSSSAYKIITCTFWWHIVHLEIPPLRLELRNETFNADWDLMLIKRWENSANMAFYFFILFLTQSRKSILAYPKVYH